MSSGTATSNALVASFRAADGTWVSSPQGVRDGVAEFQRWYLQNTKPHRIMGYRSVFISLKRPGTAPGDVTAQQMDVIADLADQFSQSEIRTTHDQNLILPHVAESDLEALLEALSAHDLAHPNLGLISDSIACPGLDFCSLANAP